jgi:hypothetical protein
MHRPVLLEIDPHRKIARRWVGRSITTVYDYNGMTGLTPESFEQARAMEPDEEQIKEEAT